MAIPLSSQLTQINLTWTNWKTYYSNKGGVYQYFDDGTNTTVWFYDLPEVYIAVMWDAAAPVPYGIINTGYSQAQNNTDLSDFQTNYQAGANKRISRTDSFGNPVVNEFHWIAVTGAIPGLTVNRASGYIATSATTSVPVRATPYSPQGTNAQRSLVSTSVNDAAAGTGARTITINYLNTSFVLKTDTVTLNGTTAVNTNATDIAFIESLVVATCGSTTGNVGTVKIQTGLAGAGSTWASIAPTDNQTFYCHHYVPTGVTCYITNIAAGATINAGVFTMQRTGNPLSITPIYNIGGWFNHLAGGNEDHSYEFPVAVTGPDYIYIIEQPHAVTASNVYANFEYVQF